MSSTVFWVSLGFITFIFFAWAVLEMEYQVHDWDDFRKKGIQFIKYLKGK